MILSTPRIIAIDDEQRDLDGLTSGLNQLGLACLPFRFTGDTEDIQPCPHVRVIFADLHLNESGAGSDQTKHFSLIGGLIEETIKPSGPYVLILWTKYSNQARSLRRFLERLSNTATPLAVKSIDKMQHLDTSRKLKNTENLVAEITGLFNQEPQITALLGWEERVLGAAAETVSSIFNLTEKQNRKNDVGKLLAHLAVGAVGKNHVEQDRFHAVNEALLPILTDRIAIMRSINDSQQKTWKKAFKNSDTGSPLDLKKAAKLNSLIHIGPSKDTVDGTRRGAVIALPKKLSEKAFKQQFGIEQGEAAAKQFFSKGFVETDAKFRWVLVQCQANCDYAQNQPGPLPYYLGLELPEGSKDKSGKPPAALWTSPPFESEGEIRLLHVSARFQVSLSPGSAKRQKSLYRLREQLLNDLIYQIHGYGARPGILSFREFSPRQGKSGKQSHGAKRK